MHYYAKVEDVFYRLFSIREGQSRKANNDYMKWSLVYDLVDQRKFAKEFTVHPDKIAIKYAGQGYETLCNFGFHQPKRRLVQLMSQNVSEGFTGRKVHDAHSLKKEATIISFPENPIRPYWIAAYFTTLNENTIQDRFKDEKLDTILYFAGKFGNLVTLLKFIQPEWESVGIEPSDNKIQWVHPTFALTRNYDA